MDAQEAGLWTTAIAGGGAALLSWIKSRPNAAVAKLLVKERNDARSELEQSQAAQRQAATALARAEAEKEALRREVEKMGEEFGAFQRKMARLYPETVGFMDSDVMPWTEAKP